MSENYINVDDFEDMMKKYELMGYTNIICAIDGKKKEFLFKIVY